GRLDDGGAHAARRHRHVLRQAHGPGAVRSGGGREHFDVDVGRERPQRRQGVLAQRRDAGRGHDDRVDQVAELVAERDAVEAEAVVTRALDDDRRHLVDAVGLGALAVDGEVEHLDGDLLGERGDLPHELLVLPTQVGGGELLREGDELHLSGNALEFLADGGLVALGQDGHGRYYTVRITLEGAGDEALRGQPLRSDRLPVQFFPRARLLGLRDPRAVHRGHQARLRGEGADRSGHRRARRGAYLRGALR